MPDAAIHETHKGNLLECMNLFKNNRGYPTIPSLGDVEFWRQRVNIGHEKSLQNAKDLGINPSAEELKQAEKSFAAQAAIDVFGRMQTRLGNTWSVTAPLTSHLGIMDDRARDAYSYGRGVDDRDNPSILSASRATDELSHLNFKKTLTRPETTYHPKWRLKKVIAGHTGWVRCVDVDPSNEWFVTGSNDKLIKIWDLASGELRLSLTGHIYAVRALTVSKRHPYLFSCGEDNTVKCWDLEQNKVVRQFHGHLSGVYALALHPTLDILSSGGRDAAVRVWDIRTREAVQVLSGHQSSIHSLVAQSAEPQLISGSQDKAIRCWDLRAGRPKTVLTHHARTVRSLCLHPRYYSFVSGAADAIKVWQGEDSQFQRNLDPCGSIVNCVAIKDDPDSAIVVAGGDNGFLHFWDWRSGVKFQSIESLPQPGSLSVESGVLCTRFDQSETRLITGEVDKTIKIWEEDHESADDA